MGLLGFPIISTNVGGIPYLIENEINGYLVNENDFESMANKVIQVFENIPKTNQLILNTKIKFEKLDWKFSREKWLKILV
jgi:glycosyltransferase involved in cell wall biosynthesis